MGFQTQPFTLSDFSGGITDNFINGQINRAEKLDNMFILQNKSIITRGGSIVDDTAHGIIPGSTDRVGALINYNNSEKLFVQSAANIYYRNPSAYSTLTGPVTSNPVFNLGDETNYISHTQWNRHLFVTNDAFAYPSKIYKDGSGNYQVRTAGLPALASSPTIAQAAFTKTGTTASGSQNITSMSDTTGLEIGQGISGTGIPAGATVSGITSSTAIVISLPATANGAATLTFTGIRSYIYTFHYFFTYTIGTQIFEDEGPTLQIQKDNFIEPSAQTAAISSIPILANGANTNWDTATIKVYIFRTAADQTVSTKIGEVTNGTTTFSDTFADSAIENNDLIYTNGGVLDNDQPPLAKYIHVTNNIAYYAHLKNGTEIMPNAYRASVPFDPDSVPGSFNDEVEDEITGFSSVQSIPIIFCKKHVYRVEGNFDEQGRGFMNHIRISDTAGCISNLGIIQAENGLFWPGNDGMYYTDGYRVLKITDHLNDTYKAMVDVIADARNITGTFDDRNRRIVWSAQQDSSNDDNDMCFVLELRWGISEEMVFSTMSGGLSFSPSALAYFNQLLYRGDSRGYVFIHDEEATTDPKVDTGVDSSLWSEQAITYNFKTIISSLGIPNLRKWVPKVILTARNRTNVSIQINAINDDGRIVRECKEIRYRGNFVWGDPEFIWGEQDCVWIAEGLIEEWRFLPAGGIRVSYIQIHVTNSYTIITSSDRLGTATFDAVARTATLDDAATYDWPSLSVDYYLSQVSDDYTKQYLVTERTSDNVLTYSDTAGTATSGSMKWELSGTRKEEILNLLSLVLMAAPVSDTIKTYQAGDDGANA